MRWMNLVVCLAVVFLNVAACAEQGGDSTHVPACRAAFYGWMPRALIAMTDL